MSNWIEDTLCDNLLKLSVCCYDAKVTLRLLLDVGHEWVLISGEIIQVRKYVDAATLKPNNSTLFSFWCCANETSHGSSCGHHGVVRAASCAELLLGTFIWPDMATKCLKVDVGGEF